MNNLKIWAVSILTAFLFGALASYFAVKARFQAKLGALTPEIIQVVKIDTLRINKPILQEIYKVEYDTIRIVLNDTIVRHDTL